VGVEHVYIVLLGAPGVGKGTQAEKLAKELSIPHISTGDMFREAVARGTEMGMKAKEYMDRGELVPDDVVIGVVKERLSQPDCANGFILDGFPRTVAQAEALERVMEELGKNIEYAISIDVAEDEIVRRLSGRRTCEACGKVYHVIYNPPKQEGVCDACGGALYQRDDDREETIRNRLRVYNEKTAPLIDFYARRGVLKRIDGSKPVDEVTADIRALLDK
jgi:adenylate kinase